MTFDDPRWLWVLAAAVPFAALGLRWFVSMSTARRWTAVGARAVLSALVVALLAGASSVREVDRLAVIAVVDVSGSVTRFAGGSGDPAGAARAWLERATAERGPDDLLGIVTFDGRAMTVATPSSANVLERSMVSSGVEGSDLAGALRYAAGLVPPDASGRVVVFSDGNATGGDAVSAARELAAGAGGNAVTVDVAPIRYRVENEVIVEQVDAPPRAVGDSMVLVRVVLRSTGPATGTLRLLREGEPVDASPGVVGTGRRVTLSAGRQVELIEARLDDARLHRFEAVFEPDAGAGGAAVDTVRSNNSGRALTVSPGRGTVLLVDGVGDATPDSPGLTLARALERSGIEVSAVGPAAMPGSLLELQGYDLVILQNVPAEAVPEAAQAQLVSYVKDLGGGLLMVGGPESFGAGGWRGSLVEPVLPVELDIPEELIVPEAALVFVLDNSGSMGRGVLGSSRSQQTIANESAARAIQTLDPQDLVGVISFNSAPAVVQELSENDLPGRTAERTRAIPSGGGTTIGPAMRIARDQLRTVDAKLKHVIVLTDGRASDADQLEELSFSMRNEDGIFVTTIAVGDEADTGTLSKMADAGGGAFFNVVNPNVLPRVFLKAVRVVRSPLVREAPFDVVMLPTGSPLTAGVVQPPRLEGLVLTQSRPEPTITYAMSTPEAEPVLAHWPVELGQVGVFTSDAHRWARRWLSWDGYTAFWTQVVRGLSRTASAGGGELRTVMTPEGMRLRFSAYTDEGEPIDLLTVPATVFGPGGTQREVLLSQTGPGEYETVEPADASGTYVVVARPRLGRTPLQPVVGGSSVASGAEFRRLESDEGLLERIALETGGRVLSLDDPETAALFDRTGVTPREASTPLWPLLLAWTVGVFLLDVGTRRVAWDRLIGDEFGTRAERRAAAARSADAASRLKEAKRSVGRRVGSAGAMVGTQAVSPARAPGSVSPSVSVSGGQQRAAGSRVPADAKPVDPAVQGDTPKKPGPKREVSDGAAGLLAAKRRARQRMDDDG